MFLLKGHFNFFQLTVLSLKFLMFLPQYHYVHLNLKINVFLNDRGSKFNIVFYISSTRITSQCYRHINTFYFQTIDGQHISAYNVRHLRSEIGIVQQEPILFDCSIRDNVLYGIDQVKNPVSEELLYEACKSANIHNFIMSLPLVSDSLIY